MEIGWIGTGVMGRSMEGHLPAAGHQVRVHNRTPGKAEDLLARGATWCESPTDVGRSCQIVFTMAG